VPVPDGAAGAAGVDRRFDIAYKANSRLFSNGETRMAQTLRIPRSDNRLSLILDEAARLFREKGYSATSMRDIATAVDMLPGSLYYHFAAKEDLLVAVYEQGVRLITEKVSAAAARFEEPWQRLEAAAVAHLEALLKTGDYALVVIRVLPQDVPKAAARLTRLRDGYETLFADLVAALPLPPETDRQSLRLLLLGALNWSQHWFRENGRNSPRSIARSFLRLLREAQQA
jgi:AcrR family transcriptional regulator